MKALGVKRWEEKLQKMHLRVKNVKISGMKLWLLKNNKIWMILE